MTKYCKKKINFLKYLTACHILQSYTYSIVLIEKTSRVVLMKFKIGQLIHHKLFNYRGVIYGTDSVFKGTEEWYKFVAQSRPPKDKPWYKVLVHNSDHTTYVAERNLEADTSTEPVVHPMVQLYFNDLKDGEYVTTILN